MLPAKRGRQNLMYTSLVLVKNLNSNSDELNFSEFKLKRIQQDDDEGFEEAINNKFPGAHVDKDDWIYERCYNDIITDWWTRIPNDIEQTLFLLRLYKIGDLAFLSPSFKKPDGTLFRISPYRVMSDVHTINEYVLEQEECSNFDEFASEMISKKNWGATWFQTARRFFLYGSSKEFNPNINEVDRIVDYMIALESILVPERRDFVGRRLRKRAISLLKNLNIDYDETYCLLRDFYKIRSTIAHGSDISSHKNGILNKHIEFESIVREVIKEAVKSLPEDDGDREKFLKELFDVSGRDRADKVCQDFCAIKDTNEEKRCFDRISTRLKKAENRKQKSENK